MLWKNSMQSHHEASVCKLSRIVALVKARQLNGLEPLGYSSYVTSTITNPITEDRRHGKKRS
jgi:hypothetical protein